MFGKDFREDAASAQNVAAMLQIEDEVYVDLRPQQRQMGPSRLRRTSWASLWMARILLLASLWRSGTCNAISQERSSAVIVLLSSFRRVCCTSCRTIRTCFLCRCRAARNPRDSIHVAKGEVQMNGNGCPNVFQHHAAPEWFGFQEGLIDKNGHVFAGTRRSQRLG